MHRVTLNYISCAKKMKLFQSSGVWLQICTQDSRNLANRCRRGMDWQRVSALATKLRSSTPYHCSVYFRTKWCIGTIQQDCNGICTLYASCQICSIIPLGGSCLSCQLCTKSDPHQRKHRNSIRGILQYQT